MNKIIFLTAILWASKRCLQRRRLLILLHTLVLLANVVSARESSSLTNGWSFKKGDQTNTAATELVDAGWQTISLPHCWGWAEAQVTNKYYRGPGWYRRVLELQPEKGKRYFLRFDAAATVADVFLNGQKLGEHRGGFGAFCFEITDALAPDGKNFLVASVSNAKEPDIAPLAICVWLSTASGRRVGARLGDAPKGSVARGSPGERVVTPSMVATLSGPRATVQPGSWPTFWSRSETPMAVMRTLRRGARRRGL